MAKTVWKYTLDEDSELENEENVGGRIFQFKIPEGAEILNVQMQEDDPRVWALVDPLNGDEIRKFVVYGTGHNIPDHLDIVYIGTVQMQSSIGGLVFHVFEVK